MVDKISKNKLDLIPNIIKFVLILPEKYPEEEPLLITTTKFSKPSLADGRDLLKKVCENWNRRTKLNEIISNIKQFCIDVIENEKYKNEICGNFYINSIYNVNNFKKRENENIKFEDCNVNEPKKIFTGKLYAVALSEEIFILFEYLDKKKKENAKIVFWSSINSIIKLKIQKKNFHFSFVKDDGYGLVFNLSIEVENCDAFKQAILFRCREESFEVNNNDLIDINNTQNNIEKNKINEF